MECVDTFGALRHLPPAVPLKPLDISTLPFIVKSPVICLRSRDFFDLERLSGLFIGGELQPRDAHQVLCRHCLRQDQPQQGDPQGE